MEEGGHQNADCWGCRSISRASRPGLSQLSKALGEDRARRNLCRVRSSGPADIKKTDIEGLGLLVRVSSGLLLACVTDSTLQCVDVLCYTVAPPESLLSGAYRTLLLKLFCKYLVEEINCNIIVGSGLNISCNNK